MVVTPFTISCRRSPRPLYVINNDLEVYGNVPVSICLLPGRLTVTRDGLPREDHVPVRGGRAGGRGVPVSIKSRSHLL